MGTCCCCFGEDGCSGGLVDTWSGGGGVWRPGGSVAIDEVE